jgi:hypothetical protein
VNAKNRRPIDRGYPLPGPQTGTEPLEVTESLKGLLANERATTLQLRSARRAAQKELEEAEAASALLIPAPIPAPIVHQRESEETEAKLAQLHEVLRASREASSQESRFQKRQARIEIAVGVAAAVVVGATILCVMHYLHSGEAAAGVSGTLVRSAASKEKPARPRSPDVDSPGQAGFVNGIGRLSRALAGFPGLDPETILRAVNKKAAASGASVCAFAWNDGQPALQFDGGHGGNTSIEATFTRCAEAVERFRE